jgi:hypothetical protein
MVSSPYLEFVNFGINKIQSKKIFIETESIISEVEAILGSEAISKDSYSSLR